MAGASGAEREQGGAAKIRPRYRSETGFREQDEPVSGQLHPGSFDALKYLLCLTNVLT